MAYIEQDCTIEHEGHKWTAGGAVVTDTHIYGYPKIQGSRGVLMDWHDQQELGKLVVTSSWKINSCFGSHMFQMEVTMPDGKVYTGRGMGDGMIFKGKAKKV